MKNSEKCGKLNRGRALMSAAVGVLAFALCVANAQTEPTHYYAITPAAGSTDPMYASSISGDASANGDPVGWATEMGSSTVAIPGITAANSVYHIWQGSLLHRSPSGSQGHGVFATPATSSIVVEDNCTWDVVGKIANGGVLTLNNLSVKSGATFYYRTNSDSTADERQTLAGTIDMAEGSHLKVYSYVHNSSKTTYLVKQATLAATVTGRGRITMLRGAAAISGTGNETTANSSKAIIQWITGDLSGFTGDLEVYGEGTQKNIYMRLMGESSIPGDPAPDELAYVIVTNAAKLRVDHDWVSPTNRIWILGASGTPEIYVDAGKTLTINGPVIGTVGLKKTGDGTLILNDKTRLSGTITVSAGKLPRVVYITPDADGTGSGGSWSSPMMLTNYLVTANIKNDDIVKLKSGHYTARIATVTLGNSITVKISGGYAGTDATTLDEDFPYSDIDFANYPSSGTYTPFLCKMNANYSATFERLQFRRARNAVFYKPNNGGTLSLSDCVVVSNGWRNYSSSSSAGGRGIHAEAGKLFMTNCVVAYNGMYSYPAGYTSSYGDHGFGAYLKNTQAEMVGCRFIGNGSRINQETTDSTAQIIRGGGRGMAVYVTGSTKLTAVDCDFVCNKAPMAYYNTTTDLGRGRGTGGTVVLDAITSTGSSFKNCAWIANMNVNDHSHGGVNNDFGGALNVNASSPTSVVNVDNCTFAFNLTDSPKASPGIDVWRGVVNVSNSVFVGNHKLASCVAGADIMVRTGAVVNVSHTLLPGTDDWNVKTETIGEDTGTLNLRDIVVGDALLASETLASTNLIQTYSKKTGTTKITLTCLRYKVANIDEVLAFDVHPRSKAGRWTESGYVLDRVHSPTIDAGDPLAPFGAEPRPNGKRLNLGRYGGTEEASLTFVTPGTFLMVQ